MLAASRMSMGQVLGIMEKKLISLEKEKSALSESLDNMRLDAKVERIRDAGSQDLLREITQLSDRRVAKLQGKLEKEEVERKKAWALRRKKEGEEDAKKKKPRLGDFGNVVAGTARQWEAWTFGSQSPAQMMKNKTIVRASDGTTLSKASVVRVLFRSVFGE